MTWQLLQHAISCCSIISTYDTLQPDTLTLFFPFGTNLCERQELLEKEEASFLREKRNLEAEAIAMEELLTAVAEAEGGVEMKRGVFFCQQSR